LDVHSQGDATRSTPVSARDGSARASNPVTQAAPASMDRRVELGRLVIWRAFPRMCFAD
jgi:hypothetical protein